MNPIINQRAFAGGMSALFDSTKPPENTYRIGINTRARKNVLAGAFKPIKITTPNAIHQAIFSLDDKLVVIIGGVPHIYNDASRTVTEIPGAASLSPTATFVYHESVPAPDNPFVVTGNNFSKTYVPAVNQIPAVTVLQDGETQPRILTPELVCRAAGTYAAWTYDGPEYIPIGRQMCYSSGTKKLFVASPDGRRVFQSVSGRPLDFVLNFNSTTGVKQSDAEGSSIVVSAARLVLLAAAQTGGFIAATRHGAFSANPSADYPLAFGEPYLKPDPLFPVGAVSHLCISTANGESVFVSPGGIQSFNEVMQYQNESNNTAFGAPISDYIIQPITRACAIRANSYTFFGMDTVFGSGILVFDNQIGAFVSIDLVGAVKEFAILDNNGQSRVFFITYTNEMYELPLYSGTPSAFHVYLGEFTTTPEAQQKPDRVCLTLNNVRNAGEVTVDFVVDRVVVDTQSRAITGNETAPTLVRTTPVDLPTEGETKAIQLAITPDNRPAGQTLGLWLGCNADAVIANVSFEISMVTKSAVVESQSTDIDEYLVVGDIYPELAVAAQLAEVTVGNHYVFYAPTAGCQLLNGSETVTIPTQYGCKMFQAKANILYGTAGGMVYGFDKLGELLDSNPDATPILLGGLGFTERVSPLLTYLDRQGRDPYYLVGPWENDDAARLLYALGYTGTTRFYVKETPRIRLFFLSFPLDSTAIPDSSGNIFPVPAEMTETGTWHAEIQATIAAAADNKLNVIISSHAPYAVGTLAPGYADFRWNFKRLGVHAVISSNTFSAYRTYVDGVHYITVGTGNTLHESSATYFGGRGILALSATATGLRGVYRDGSGRIFDRFFIPV